MEMEEYISGNVKEITSDVAQNFFFQTGIVFQYSLKSFSWFPWELSSLFLETFQVTSGDALTS